MFGTADRNIKMIREALGVSIGRRQTHLVVRGREPAVSKAAAVLEHLAHSAVGRRFLSREEVLNAIVEAPAVPRRDETLDISKTPAWKGDIEVRASGRIVRAKSTNQEQYIEAMRTSDLVFAVGPAGTGKTYLSVAAAIHMLRTGRVKRIVLARPAVEAGERLGFLPGDLQDKVNPYLRPLLDALEDMLDYSTLQRFITNDVIEIVPLAFMRGRTLNDAVIILDEAQNATKSQMLMFLTRIGRSSKAVVTGDITQTDLEDPTSSGLIDAFHRLRRVPGCSFVSLDRTDIVRHAIVERVVRAYADKNTSAAHLNADEFDNGLGN